ncbi:MAG: glycosyltransferase, partial [Candidatus Fonsibacter ubiquis]
MSENAFEWASCIVYYEDNNALQNLINDLLNQTIKPSHIYISDNDSKLSPLINRNEINITIIKLQKNLGFGAAANTAIKRAIENKYNKFILFSQDVLLEDTSCEKMIKQLNLNPGIIFPTMKNRKNNKIFSKGGTINKITGKIKLSTKKVSKNIVWADGSCLCFDEMTFNLLKGFNEDYF